MNEPDEKPLAQHGFLAGGGYPPGFEKGRRLLAECPEFKLWEMYKPGGEQILESSIAIETAYHKEGLRINDASDPIERIAWATALSRLAGVAHAFPKDPMPLEVFFSYDYDFKWPGNAATASKLAATLGKEILGVLNSADSKQKAEECVGKFKNALDALIRERSAKAIFCTEYLLIIHARNHFHVFQERPRKSLLREQLEQIGICYKGKNAKATWREKFSNAGLGELPD